MPKGFSLHIGVNKYDRVCYSRMGFNNPAILPNCDNDAVVKMAIAERFKFNSAILINEEATTKTVLDGIKVAARCLDYGDIFFLSFSGHGYHVNDRNGDEDDKFDETWCLYDGMIIDDELFEHWKLFRPGVRILVIADCCHSGTSIKGLKKSMDRLAGRFPVEKTDEVQASCLLLSACQDEQDAYAGNNLDNSLYTYWMLKVLERYEFCDSYNELHKRISACMPASSKPNLFKFGPGADQFARKRPFRI